MARSFKTPVDAPGVSVNGTAVSVEGHTHAGGGGAPTDATYVVTSSNATLTNERVLTQGSYLTITDNGSSTVTVAVDASTTANGKVVARDASGNFSAGTITAALTGTASGNIANTLVDAKGDLIGASADNTPARVGPVGANGTALVADSTATPGVAWSTTINGTAIPSSATLVTTTRTITTTAPLRIAAGASADLSADRTLSINNFTGDSGSGGAAGAVPAPASGDAAAGKFLKADGTWAAPSASGGSTYVAQFSKAGTIATGTGTFRWYNDSGATRTIGTVRASVGTAPTGASLIVDVNVSASGAAPATIYSTQANRPSIAASAFTATGSTKSTTTIANGDYFTVDIDQVGSTVAGSDLTVLIWLT